MLMPQRFPDRLGPPRGRRATSSSVPSAATLPWIITVTPGHNRRTIAISWLTIRKARPLALVLVLDQGDQGVLDHGIDAGERLVEHIETNSRDLDEARAGLQQHALTARQDTGGLLGQVLQRAGG